MVRIPENKKYFRIGEASRIVGVEPYVLRYWESEFSQIRPQRADSNQRTYQRQDLERLVEIKQLLYEEKMTIEGARLRLKGEKPEISVSLDPDVEGIKMELRQILKILG
ncbi:MAG: MerR family transcriptional regulator [Desulfobacteraceae bacterium 4572_87]|nr:MAG: MerR family transcriptional regulator [Desulfobacteraceae bacterium 4572_87]